ncbi:MAG: class I SAM-dependent methyltransferase [Spirochaetales bacterium]|nr:class I SAM-dependent methyltransferase [Spirochaetales bacterium]
MEKTFEKNSRSYSRVRPGYPAELYERIARFKKFDSSSRLLEIGAGHGVATGEVYTRWNSKILAIEPGQSLCEMGEKQFSEKGDVEFQCVPFEDFHSDIRFDGIYAATAFHWLDEEIKFRKSSELLKEKGLLFLFWNYYTISDDKVFEDIQQIYRDFHPKGAGKGDPRVFTREKINKRRDEMIQSEYFEQLDHWEYSYDLNYSADRYIQLLKTYPINNHPPEIMTPFYEKFHDYISERGDKLTITILVCSDIGEKVKTNL